MKSVLLTELFFKQLIDITQCIPIGIGWQKFNVRIEFNSQDGEITRSFALFTGSLNGNLLWKANPIYNRIILVIRLQLVIAVLSFLYNLLNHI